jgi:hypothetical protein
MPAPKSRPQLQAPDLTPHRAADAARPARTDPNDPRFAGAEQFETHAALVRGVQNGSVRVVNPETLPRPPAADTPRRRSPELSLSTKVPEYVMQQLRHRYADTGVTIPNQILLALQKDGLEIDDDDIQDERKRQRR